MTVHPRPPIPMHRLLAFLGCGLFALVPPVLADRDSVRIGGFRAFTTF